MGIESERALIMRQGSACIARVEQRAPEIEPGVEEIGIELDRLFQAGDRLSETSTLPLRDPEQLISLGWARESAACGCPTCSASKA